MSKLIKRATDSDLSLSTAPTPYECCGLFDPCTDADLMSLSFQGADPFLDWLSWKANIECNIRKDFIAYVKPQAAENGACTTGVQADPCSDPATFSWGKCEFLLHDFGRLRERGPVRDITTNVMKYCANQVRYRLDGAPINDTRELDMVMATEVIMQQLRHQVIVGNHATPGSTDGLQVLLSSDYHNPDGEPCPLMNSNVINWAGNPMSGGAGITWNGTAQPATANLVDFLLAIYNRIRQRLSWSPQLARGLQVGDMVLVMPTFMVQCLLDFYTCWSVCPGNFDSGVGVMINNLEGRRYRDTLNGGTFGFGQITLNGFTIPLIQYDWDTIAGPKTGDIYFLTSQVGGIRLLEGQYLDMRAVPGTVPGSAFGYTDGGRILTWNNQQNTCYEQIVEMRPRLLCWAPWAQAVINNVQCGALGGVLSPDPCSGSFGPAGSIDPAECSDGEVAAR